MLIPLPKEMIDNPSCYRDERGKGYVPTETATEAERKAIEAFNEAFDRGQALMIQIEMTHKEKKELTEQARKQGKSDKEIEDLFSDVKIIG